MDKERSMQFRRLACIWFVQRLSCSDTAAAVQSVPQQQPNSLSYCQ
jgi:hypothetical protein